jgi:hypothetical protein
MRDTAELITRLVHGGGPGAAARHLAGLSRDDLCALAIALAAARRPKWIRPDDGTVDEVVVERAVAGEPVQLTRPEREAAAAAIIARGGGTTALAEQLHLSGTTAANLYEKVTGQRPERPDPRARGSAVRAAREAAAAPVIAAGATVTDLAAHLDVSWPVAREVYDRVNGGDHPRVRGWAGRARPGAGTRGGTAGNDAAPRKVAR